MSLDKQEFRRQEKLFELANFERNYVSNLNTLKTRVIDPLRERKMLAEVHMDVLFSNIEDILELHKEFLHHLVSQQRDDVVIDRVHGEGNFMGKLALYRDYAEAHDRQRKRLLDLQKQAEFVEFLEECWQKMDRKDVDLYSYLSLPFYQVVQYPPILSKIIKNTPESHPDMENLNQTIPAAGQLASKCRETFLQVQNASRMQELAEQVTGFDVLKPGREFMREGEVDIIDSRHHKRYAFLFNDVLLLVRPKGRTFKTIRAIPVRKAIFQFKDELKILFDYNQLARLFFKPNFRQMWYKALRSLQQPGRRWPTDIRINSKSSGALVSTANASELEEMKKKQRKLLQLVDKYEQLSSLHLTAMTKNAQVVSQMQKRIDRLEKQVKILGGETAVDFVALDQENQKLMLENEALKEGLNDVEQKVRKARSRGSSFGSSSDIYEGEDKGRMQSRTESVSSINSNEAENAQYPSSFNRQVTVPDSTFDDFAVASTVTSRAGDQTTLDDILTPNVVMQARRNSRSASEEESSSFIEP